LTFRTLRRVPNIKHLLTTYLILDIILPQLKRLLCILELLGVAIVGTEDILHMPIALKALNVRNVVVLTELRTTDYWLGVTKPIPSLTLLEKQLQLVYLVLTLSSV